MKITYQTVSEGALAGLLCFHLIDSNVGADDSIIPLIEKIEQFREGLQRDDVRLIPRVLRLQHSYISIKNADALLQHGYTIHDVSYFPARYAHYQVLEIGAQINIPSGTFNEVIIREENKQFDRLLVRSPNYFLDTRTADASLLVSSSIPYRVLPVVAKPVRYVIDGGEA